MEACKVQPRGLLPPPQTVPGSASHQLEPFACRVLGRGVVTGETKGGDGHAWLSMWTSTASRHFARHPLPRARVACGCRWPFGGPPNRESWIALHHDGSPPKKGKEGRPERRKNHPVPLPAARGAETLAQSKREGAWPSVHRPTIVGGAHWFWKRGSCVVVRVRSWGTQSHLPDWSNA